VIQLITAQRVLRASYLNVELRMHYYSTCLRINLFRHINMAFLAGNLLPPNFLSVILIGVLLSVLVLILTLFISTALERSTRLYTVKLLLN